MVRTQAPGRSKLGPRRRDDKERGVNAALAECTNKIDGCWIEPL